MRWPLRLTQCRWVVPLVVFSLIATSGAEAQTLWPCPSPYVFNTDYVFVGNYYGRQYTETFQYGTGNTGLPAIGVGTYYFDDDVSDDLLFTLRSPWILAACSRWLFVGPFNRLSSVIFIESVDHGGTMAANFGPPPPSDECGAETLIAQTSVVGARKAQGSGTSHASSHRAGARLGSGLGPTTQFGECVPDGGGGNPPGGGGGGTQICLWQDYYDPDTFEYLYSVKVWCAPL